MGDECLGYIVFSQEGVASVSFKRLKISFSRF